MLSIKTSDEKLKFVIIGNPGVGKTSLRRSYLGESFESNYMATVGSDFSYLQVEIDQTTIGLSLWDLAGEISYKSINRLFYVGSNGVIVVYSVTDLESYQEVINWIEDFTKELPNSKIMPPILILANKIDLRNQDGKEVSIDMHHELIEMVKKKYHDFGEITDYQTSAKTGANVTHAITTFVKLCSEFLQLHPCRGDDGPSPTEKIVTKGYIFAMNQVAGPLFIAYEPLTKPDQQETFQMLNLVSSVDHEQIIYNSTLTNMFRWTDNSILYYIAFIIQNPNARNGNELFFIGLSFAKKFEQKINDNQGIIDGYLHTTLNQFVKIHSDDSVDFITKRVNEGDFLSSKKKMNLIIRDLIEELNQVLHQFL